MTPSFEQHSPVVSTQPITRSDVEGRGVDFLQVGRGTCRGSEIGCGSGGIKLHRDHTLVRGIGIGIGLVLSIAAYTLE